MIIAVLLALWLIGLIAHVAGGLIYILLVAAVVIFIYDTFVAHRRN
jgi:hypothetical protein